MWRKKRNFALPMYKYRTAINIALLALIALLAALCWRSIAS